MKAKLAHLYDEHLDLFKSIPTLFPQDDLHGPLLISPNTLFAKQKNKLMIIGQETKGWPISTDIKKQQSHYEAFNLGIYYKSTPFWDSVRKIEKLLGNGLYSSVWTNISKFDVNKSRGTKVYEREISKLDFLLLEEIRITYPDICLFFTGPAFDHRISNIFKGVTFEKISIDNGLLLDQLVHPDLPKYTYRTYHPKYLRLRGKESVFFNFLSSLMV